MTSFHLGQAGLLRCDEPDPESCAQWNMVDPDLLMLRISWSPLDQPLLQCPRAISSRCDKKSIFSRQCSSREEKQRFPVLCNLVSFFQDTDSCWTHVSSNCSVINNSVYGTARDYTPIWTAKFHSSVSTPQRCNHDHAQ